MKAAEFRGAILIPPVDNSGLIDRRRRGKILMLLAELWEAVEVRHLARCWSRGPTPPTDPACLCTVTDYLRACPCTLADARIDSARQALGALP